MFFQKRELEPLPAVIEPEVPKNEREYLKRVQAESRAVLDAPLEAFEVVTQQPGWTVLRKPVAGTKLTMARLEAEVPLPPDELYSLLRTMEGKRIIDPFPREKHSLPVKKLRAPSRKGDAEIVFSEAPRFHGILRPREYVTCDASDPQTRLFVCKSARVASGERAAAAPGRVRANLLFAMRTAPAEGRSGASRLQMVNWLDLGANTVPPLMANAVTERWYFQALMRRLNRHLQQQRGGSGGGSDGGPKAAA